MGCIANPVSPRNQSHSVFDAGVAMMKVRRKSDGKILGGWAAGTSSI